jgi:hypothetical protein
MEITVGCSRASLWKDRPGEHWREALADPPTVFEPTGRLRIGALLSVTVTSHELKSFSKDCQLSLTLAPSASRCCLRR